MADGTLEARINQVNVLSLYESGTNTYDPSFVEKWDYIQKKLRCCGPAIGTGFRGYQGMASKKLFTNGCVPDSCCIKGCKSISGSSCKEQTVFNEIYNEACFDVMIRQFQKGSLRVFLLMISIGMAITAMVGIINVALAAAFVAQLHRRQKTWDVSQGQRDDPPMRMEDFQ